MTREDAVAAAHRDAEMSGQPQTVYRFPAWRPHVYGVRAADQLPPEAQKFETCRPTHGVVAPVSAAPAAAAEQGSLF